MILLICNYFGLFEYFRLGVSTISPALGDMTKLQDLDLSKVLMAAEGTALMPYLFYTDHILCCRIFYQF